MTEKPWHETLRVGLIKWNVAPLGAVVFICVINYQVVQKVINPGCEASEWYIAGLCALIPVLAGIVYKMYESMQRDRGCDAND